MSDAAAALEEQARAWTEPVPGAAPAGSDARYEPAYEALSERLAVLDTVSDRAVDWEAARAEAMGLLQGQSKDLLVASWLTAALYERDGFDGLAAGLWGLSTLVEDYWDELFPAKKRMRGRVSALSWLLERLGQRLEGAPPPSHDAFGKLDQATQRFVSAVRERFEEHAPAMRPLTGSVERIRLSLPPPPPEEAEARGSEPRPASDAGLTAPVSAEPPPTAHGAESAIEADSGATGGNSGEDGAKPSDGDVLEGRVRPMLAPIPGDNPAGADERYHEDYKAICQEIAKLENLQGEVDWNAVVRRGEAFLTNTSKDLLIASYVAYGRVELDGVDGAATGLALLASLSGTFWEAMHPERIPRRASAIRFTLERLEAELAQDPPPQGAKDPAVVHRLEVASRVFTGVIRERFGEHAPGLRALKDAVERLKLSLPKPEVTKPEPKPAAPTSPPPAQTPSSPAAVTPAAARAPQAKATVQGADIGAIDAADPEPFMSSLSKATEKAARAVFRASKAHPLAYTLRRVSLFLDLRSLVAMPQGGVTTEIPPPEYAYTSTLERLLAASEWADLLDEAESNLSENRFWLDANRYVYLALQGLGHAEAARAVAAETASAIMRFPELKQLEFIDGTRLASDTTLDWLAETVGIGGGPSAQSEVDPGADPVVTATKEAKALAASGKQQAALEILQNSTKAAEDDRTRFRIELAAARICAESGSPKPAKGIYAGLLHDIDRIDLERWEPALSKEVLLGYHDLLTKEPDNADRADDVYRRLCRIDLLTMTGRS